MYFWQASGRPQQIQKVSVPSEMHFRQASGRLGANFHWFGGPRADEARFFGNLLEPFRPLLRHTRTIPLG